MEGYLTISHSFLQVWCKMNMTLFSVFTLWRRKYLSFSLIHMQGLHHSPFIYFFILCNLVICSFCSMLFYPYSILNSPSLFSVPGLALCLLALRPAHPFTLLWLQQTGSLSAWALSPSEVAQAWFQIVFVFFQML